MFSSFICLEKEISHVKWIGMTWSFQEFRVVIHIALWNVLLNVYCWSVTFLCIYGCMCERLLLQETESHGPCTVIYLRFSKLWIFIWEVKENYFSMLLDIFSFHKRLYLNYSVCYRHLDIYNMIYMGRSHRNIPKYIMHMHKENKAFLGPSRFFFFYIAALLLLFSSTKFSKIYFIIEYMFLQIMIKTYKTIFCITVMREVR